jgi:hypothetical protein
MISSMAPSSASRWLSAWCAVVASVLVTACGGSSPSGPPPPPPTEFSLMPGGTFDELVVTWTPPPTPVDGFELQLRMERDPWQTLQGDLSGNAIGAFVTLVAAVPELVTISGRVRASRGGRTSDWSGEASIFRGLRAPADGVATLEDLGHLRLTWAQPSTAATDVRVERARSDDGSYTWSAWAVVDTIPAASTTWLDASGLEPNVAYQYRIKNLATWHGNVIESGEVIISGWRTSVVPPAVGGSAGCAEP